MDTWGGLCQGYPAREHGGWHLCVPLWSLHLTQCGLTFLLLPLSWVWGCSVPSLDSSTSSDSWWGDAGATCWRDSSSGGRHGWCSAVLFFGCSSSPFVHRSSTATIGTVHKASVRLLWQVLPHQGCLSEEAARQEDLSWGVQCCSLSSYLGAGGSHVGPRPLCCCSLTLCHYCSGFCYSTTTSSLRYILQVVPWF